ncbi:hypothetical protein NVP1248O_78 [Vibrio phage 1.248.O._10N.261.54.F1]|nr:hypothetical protein NVP1248O_78 [Vibrio phage 1.248.O._10N.261.54.F1]
MKTFETEKHNIPKGATHYWNESCSGFFAWWNDNTKEMLCPDGLGTWCRASDLSDDIMHEIPSPHTETEFVKVEFKSDKEKAEAFIEGGLRYFTRGAITGDKEKDTIPVTRLDELLCGASIYRKVETEIDERQEFIEVACERSGLSKHSVEAQVFGVIFDSGEFKLVEK